MNKATFLLAFCLVFLSSTAQAQESIVEIATTSATESLNNRAEQRREAIQNKIEDRKEAVTEKIEERKEKIQNKIEEKKEAVMERVEERKETIKKRVEERAAKRVLELSQRTEKKLLAAMNRFKKLAERTEERVKIMFEKEIISKEVADSANTKTAEAKALLENAIVDAQKIMESAESAVSGENAKEIFAKTKELAKSSQDKIKEAHLKIVEAIKGIKASLPKDEGANNDTIDNN